jgi:putative flippase GtrA
MIKNLTFQFSKYASVGLINTLLDFSVYLILTRFIYIFSINIFTAKAISFFVAMNFSFFANRWFTFKRSDLPTWQEFIKFYLTVGSGIFINVGVHYLVVKIFGLSDILGVIAAAGFTAFWGFGFSKLWVFRK